jgi:ABC-type multidrug transport system ATPase subunit
MNIIETRNLTQRYWTKASLHDLWSAGHNPSAGWTTKVLFDITLSVPHGSFYALVGANGAGKTTTLKVLMNLLSPIGREGVRADRLRLGKPAIAKMDDRAAISRLLPPVLSSVGPGA